MTSRKICLRILKPFCCLCHHLFSNDDKTGSWLKHSNILRVVTSQTSKIQLSSNCCFCHHFVAYVIILLRRSSFCCACHHFHYRTAIRRINMIVEISKNFSAGDRSPIGRPTFGIGFARAHEIVAYVIKLLPMSSFFQKNFLRPILRLMVDLW